MFFWNVLFHVFSQNRLPKSLQNVSILSHLEVQDDAMSPLCDIFANRIFERPYSDLSIFSHVSGTRKLKKICRKALKTFLAAHDEKTHLETTHGSENVKKTTPTEVKMDDLAATTAPSFSPGWPLGRHMGTKISKNTFPVCDFMKNLQNVTL